MSYRIPRIVPWTSHEEYELVALGLFAEDPAQRHSAVQRVRAWTSRGKVPHAIDCTATLVELGLLTEQHSAHIAMRAGEVAIGSYDTALSSNSLRLMLSMALIRFVNGFVDAQQQGTYALSVAALADQLGIPSWFVELRHAGTHELLPGLSVLRMACSQALRWLYDNYWAVQRSYIQEAMGELRVLLTEYKLARKKGLKAKKSEMEKTAGDEARLLRHIIGLADADTFEDILVPLLLEPGFMVPLARKKRVTTAGVALSGELVRLWQPVLARLGQTLQRSGFIEVLVHAILGVLAADSATRRVSGNQVEGADGVQSASYCWTLVGWVRYFVEQLYRRRRSSKTSLPVLPHLDDVIERSLRSPNIYTYHILQIIGNCDSTLARELTPFLGYMECILEPTKISATASQLCPTALQEMEAEITRLQNTIHGSASWTSDMSDTSLSKQDEDSRNAPVHRRWMRAPGWQTCPVGCLPQDGRLPDLSLPHALDEDSTL